MRRCGAAAAAASLALLRCIALPQLSAVLCCAALWCCSCLLCYAALCCALAWRPNTLTPARLPPRTVAQELGINHKCFLMAHLPAGQAVPEDACHTNLAGDVSGTQPVTLQRLLFACSQLRRAACCVHAWQPAWACGVFLKPPLLLPNLLCCPPPPLALTGLDHGVAAPQGRVWVQRRLAQLLARHGEGGRAVPLRPHSRQLSVCSGEL